MSKKLALHEAKLKRELDTYVEAHVREASMNYGYYKDIEKENLQEKQKIAGYIHNQYDTMDLNEIKKIAMQCVSEKKLRQILLEFELQYYVETPAPMSLDVFIKKAKAILDRYQCKAGGYYIEDMEWEIHRFDSTVYEVKDYNVLFVNSIDKTDKDDNETLRYMKQLAVRLNSLSNDITVDYEFREPENGLIWIEIWCTHLPTKENSPVISV